MRYYKIRKMTPREVGRLMGVSEEKLDIMLNSGISDGHLYKMFGNSIAVGCMTHIFRNLFVDRPKKTDKTLW